MKTRFPIGFNLNLNLDLFTFSENMGVVPDSTMENLDKNIKYINRFLGNMLDAEKMAKSFDKSLYRNRK